MGKKRKKQQKKRNEIHNTRVTKGSNLYKEDVRLSTTVINTIHNSEIKITVYVLGPEKQFMVPLMIEIENFHLHIIENHHFNIDTYGLPHRSLYDFNFEKVIYYPYSRIIDGKHTETYNINMFISTKYKTKGINPIYMHQINKNINPVRGWILKFEEPPQNSKYHVLHTFNKDIYPNDNEDRNLNSYNKEKTRKDIARVKKRYADKLVNCLKKKEGEFMPEQADSGRNYTPVPKDQFEDLSLLQKINLMIDNKSEDNEVSTELSIIDASPTIDESSKVKNPYKDYDVDVFDLESIEAATEDEQLEKLADQIYNCLRKNKPIVLKNNLADKSVEKSSKTEPKNEPSSGLDLERALEKIKKPIPKDFFMTLSRLSELKI